MTHLVFKNLHVFLFGAIGKLYDSIRDLTSLHNYPHKKNVLVVNYSLSIASFTILGPLRLVDMLFGNKNCLSLYCTCTSIMWVFFKQKFDDLPFLFSLFFLPLTLDWSEWILLCH